MSIPLSSTMSMFSFTKVENWKNVNFLPKCTRLHQIASQISKTPIPGKGTPHPQTLPHWVLRPFDGPPWEFHTPPWNKRLHKALSSHLQRPYMSTLSDSLTCAIRRTRTTYGNRCFAVAGPRVWNSLPTKLIQSNSLGQCKWWLKTQLFGFMRPQCLMTLCN